MFDAPLHGGLHFKPTVEGISLRGGEIPVFKFESRCQERVESFECLGSNVEPIKAFHQRVERFAAECVSAYVLFNRNFPIFFPRCRPLVFVLGFLRDGGFLLFFFVCSFHRRGRTSAGHLRDIEANGVDT